MKSRISKTDTVLKFMNLKSNYLQGKLLKMVSFRTCKIRCFFKNSSGD